MISPSAGVRIMLASRPVDFRNGLATFLCFARSAPTG
jgi:hypothetical protein